jgi:hypothetical protein
MIKTNDHIVVNHLAKIFGVSVSGLPFIEAASIMDRSNSADLPFLMEDVVVLYEKCSALQLSCSMATSSFLYKALMDTLGYVSIVTEPNISGQDSLYFTKLCDMTDVYWAEEVDAWLAKLIQPKLHIGSRGDYILMTAPVNAFTL